MDNSQYATNICRQLLDQFTDMRELTVMVYLLAVVDDESTVRSSVYAMAQQLKMHRQTLAHVLNRICGKGYAAWHDDGKRYLRVDINGGLTQDVTDNVTSMQPTWCVSLRLARWARNEQSFKDNKSYDKGYRPTSADYIREAELRAIRETEEFVRMAKIRRGGVPPHLPF